MIKGFKQFILRGNVVDLAVGVVIGAAFNAVVASFVKDLITPIVAALFGSPDFHELFFTINGSKFMYGDFFNSGISFLLVSASIYFFVIVPLNALISRSRKEAPTDPTTKKCPECLSEISIEAKRCAYCTSLLVAA